MLQERIEYIAGQFDWVFAYGKDHWQNVGDGEDDTLLPFADRKKYLKLLWVDDTDVLNSEGATEGYIHDGEMVMLVRSKISDESYEYKYQTHIKNLKGLLTELKDEIGNCDGFRLKAWRITEVENLYDANMDGLKVTFKIENSNI